MSWKFESSSKKFHKQVESLLKLNYSKKDLIHHYPAIKRTAAGTIPIG